VLNKDAVSRIENWKFGQALRYVDPEDTPEFPLLVALDRLWGDTGGMRSGRATMPLLEPFIGAAVEVLLADVSYEQHYRPGRHGKDHVNMTGTYEECEAARAIQAESMPGWEVWVERVTRKVVTDDDSA
jgi:hypothetical protein